MREEILSLLAGQKPNQLPAFSGLIHITAEGLQREGLAFHEVHQDAHKMALAAASTFRLTGMPSATLPLDLCTPAEAFGAQLKFYPDQEMRFPQVVSNFLFQSTREFNTQLNQYTEILHKGRLDIVYDAIRLLKKDIGMEAVISGMIPGPYTLLLYLCHPRNLFIEMKRDPQPVLDAVLHLSMFLSRLGAAYRNAGADFITIHEMGGSPGFLGPALFKQFVFPALQRLIAELPKPSVLSICGSIDKTIPLVAQTGANAISVDQTTDLFALRSALQDTFLFGNLDPVQTLANGTAGNIQDTAQSAIRAGVDAVWPGCDLALQTPLENLKIFLNSGKS